MFDKLKKHWKTESTMQVVLILLTFACTGTTVAWLSRSGVALLGIADSAWYIRFGYRLFMFVFGYQILILCFGFVFGQFAFFWNYEKKIMKWMLGLFNKQKTNDPS